MADIKSNDRLIVKKVDPQAPEEGNKYGKNGYKLRVVEWIYAKRGGGEGSSISLEKRETFVGDDGDVRIGKAKGFSLEDLALVKANWNEIIAAMGQATEPAKPKGNPIPAAPLSDAEAPW